VVTLADEVLAPRVLATAHLALSNLDVDIREVDRLLIRGQLATGVDALTLHRDLETIERRLLALQLVAQLRAFKSRERLILLDDIAGLHEIVRGAGSDGEHRRAHSRDHGALRGDVTNERTPRHFGDAHALDRYGNFSSEPVPTQDRKHAD